MINPWKTIKKNTLYQNKFGYSLRDDDVITPAGTEGKYMVLESRDFVAIIAITQDNQIIMVRHWRYTVGQEFLEIPAGKVDDNEDILDAAKRELLEETGAVSNDWKKLKSYWVGNGAIKMRGHIFLAKNTTLTGKDHQESTEKLSLETYSYSELIDMLSQDIISDERSILALLLVKDHL